MGDDERKHIRPGQSHVKGKGRGKIRWGGSATEQTKIEESFEEEEGLVGTLAEMNVTDFGLKVELSRIANFELNSKENELFEKIGELLKKEDVETAIVRRLFDPQHHQDRT